MKSPLSILLILAALLCWQGLAQEVRMAPATTIAVLPAAPSIDDTALLEPPAPVEKPDFQIESTQVKLLDVVESPPMPGLPPVEGTITLKVHSVADPGLPEPPAPSPVQYAENGQLCELLAEYAKERQKIRHAFISATVYDHSRTRLTCYPSGGRDHAVTVWSNIDFNHFGGIVSFEATGADGEPREYFFLMGIGNENTEFRAQKLAEHGIQYEPPEIPDIPDGAPAFVIESNDPHPESITLIEDLHALYRDEGVRMAEQAAAREAATEARRRHYLANPPKPKDVTIHFWKRTP